MRRNGRVGGKANGVFGCLINCMINSYSEDGLTFTDIICHLRDQLPVLYLLPKEAALREVKKAIMFGLRTGILTRQYDKFKINLELEDVHEIEEPETMCEECLWADEYSPHVPSNAVGISTKKPTRRKRQTKKKRLKNTHLGTQNRRQRRGGRISRGFSRNQRSRTQRQRRRRSKCLVKKDKFGGKYSPTPDRFPEPVDRISPRSSKSRLKVAEYYPEDYKPPNMVMSTQSVRTCPEDYHPPYIVSSSESINTCPEEYQQPAIITSSESLINTGPENNQAANIVTSSDSANTTPESEIKNDKIEN